MGSLVNFNSFVCKESPGGMLCGSISFGWCRTQKSFTLPYRVCRVYSTIPGVVVTLPAKITAPLKSLQYKAISQDVRLLGCTKKVRLLRGLQNRCK